MGKYWLIGLLLIGLGWAHGAEAATCSVSANSIPFATYSTTQVNSSTVSSSISVTCTPGVLELVTGVAVTVGLSPGQGMVMNRYMSNGVDKLYYNVYKDPGYQTVLGTGGGQGQTYTLCMGALVCGNSATNTVGTNLILYMYGALPPKQDISPGMYTDSLLLQLTF